ncbi:PIN domain-like protein [Chlamydoabsidia padenii]|nr:PIN domain-like protein [Chlamydoabsidia padenii]
MGIYGLSTFVQNHPSLNVQKAWYLCDGNNNDDHLVFDGNAFVYHYAYLHREHWTHGGQYKYLSLVIRHLIKTLRQGGLTLTFFFDGALPPEKQETRLKRYKSYVERSALTMQNLSSINASNKNHATAFLLEGPQYRHDVYVIPPLTLEVCIQTLRELSVMVVMCSGEADGPVARLAEETQGYIVSKDTDMHIYPKGGKGYISLDSLNIPSWDDSTTKKAITATVCSAQDLAHLLGLETTMLPLFGTLVGNDYMDVQVIRYPIVTWCSVNLPSQPQLQGHSQWHKCVAEFIRQMDYLTTTRGGSSSIISTIVSELTPILLSSNMTKKEDKVRMMEHTILESIQRYVFEDLASPPSEAQCHTLTNGMASQQYSRDLLDLSTTQLFWGNVFLEDMQQESSWCLSRTLRQAIYRWNNMVSVKEYVREKQHLSSQVVLPSSDPAIINTIDDHITRQQLFLQLHHVSIPMMTTLNANVVNPLQPLVICLRYFIQQSYDSGNILADHEVLAILVASLVDLVPVVLPDEFSISDGPSYLTSLSTSIAQQHTLVASSMVNRPKETTDDGNDDDELKIPSLKKRSIQLTTQWQHTLLSSHLLAQVLLSPPPNKNFDQQHLQQTGLLAHCYNGVVMHTCLQMGRLGASMGRMMLGASTKWMSLFGSLYDLVTAMDNTGREIKIEKVFDYKFNKAVSSNSWMKSRILKKLGKKETETTHIKKVRKTGAKLDGVKPKGNVFDVLSYGCQFDE